jgi:hypothetical protein
LATHGHTFVLCASVKLCDHESFNVKKERKRERGMDRERETHREMDIEGKKERERDMGRKETEIERVRDGKRNRDKEVY